MSDDMMQSVAAVAQIDAVPRILEVVCRTTGMGFAAVARVTPERWVACAVKDDIGFGLAPGGELKIATTICDQIRDTGSAVVIDHVAHDPDYAQHPTPRMYGFESYISVPIRHRGAFFGTLCAIDPRPARLKTPEVIGMFELFAELIGSYLDSGERLASSEAALVGERETAELRDQFIAILGHDLRNPVAAVEGGLRLLRKSATPEKAELIVGHMESSLRRMTSLINDVMDFAKGRLGGGLDVRRQALVRLEDTLEAVVDEFRLAQPGRAIVSAFDIGAPVDCDAPRIAQLMSNLIANALAHGAKDTPIVVRGQVAAGRMVLSVSNAGEAIPRETQARLFQPFYRGQTMGQGLGLGLYIASQIAAAHGGVLAVASEAAETRFTFSMPLRLDPAASAEAEAAAVR